MGEYLVLRASETIGTTPRQLKRIIRQQALLLCLIGIPAGLLLGYGIGAAVLYLLSCAPPSWMQARHHQHFACDLCWLHAVCPADGALVLFQAREMAARVSPVEATKYTDVMQTQKTAQHPGSKAHQMAFANLGRNKKRRKVVVFWHRR